MDILAAIKREERKLEKQLGKVQHKKETRKNERKDGSKWNKSSIPSAFFVC
jgi:hypothetical protein